MVSINEMSIEDMKREIEAYRLKADAKIHLGVGQKGGVCVYGLQRFPITLYPSQMAKLLDMKEKILAFIEEHKSELSYKV